MSGRRLGAQHFVGALLSAVLATAAVAHPVVGAFERFYAGVTDETRIVDGGLLLLNELNCVACHAAPETWRAQVPGRGRISLAGAGERWRGDAIGTFIATPHAVKAGTTMPQLGTGDPAEAKALAAYVGSIAPASPPKPKSFPTGSAPLGRRLFHAVGCVACHGAKEDGVGGSAGSAAVPIGLASHYERTALAAFLQNPLHTRPAGRMPATELTNAEASDLAAYLHELGSQPAATRTVALSGTTPSDAALVAHGRAQFVARNCAACHESGDGLAPRTAKPLAVLETEKGCLAPASAPASDAPRFELSEPQRRALAAALRRVQTTPVPAAQTAEQRVAAKFEQLNCYACHEWRGRGGVEATRTKFFTATDSAVESLGELGHLPPKLDSAGRKLTPAWLEKLLWGQGGGVRPYMTARMPRFGADAAGELGALLGEACRPAKPQEIDTSGSKGHQRFATGRTLLGTGGGGIGCVACHGLKGREPAGVRAINLTHTAQRLQPEYFKALLLDPQGVQPGTIMPPLFAGRKGAANEIESIWTYFKELDQSDVLPDGLAIAGSFELKPAEEGKPIVFRTFLEGAGTQAIAVGFPAGVHAAFDAFEVRWALAWQGGFLDAQSNWEERPMKPVKPLGEAKRVLATHLPLARLGSATDPWPTKFGAYAGYVFKGYRLATDGTPTFRYTIDELEVEDTVRPASDGRSLRRTLTLRGGKSAEANWYFRGLGPGLAPQPVVWRDGVAIIEETISL